MASDLFEKWARQNDSIHRGYTPAGMANGLTATGGWSFPRVRGGYNLYRGLAGVESIDFDVPVGAAGANAQTIGNFPWRPHRTSTDYHYTLRAVGGGGVESAAAVPARLAEFDSSRTLREPRPSSPSGLSVTPAAGGRFLLRWMYDPRGEDAAPENFRIYHDNGTGTVDYGTFVKKITYRPGRVHYEWLSTAFSHGDRRLWAVRAVSEPQVNDGGTAQVFAFADAAAPSPHPGPRLTRLADEEDVQP